MNNINTKNEIEECLESRKKTLKINKKFKNLNLDFIIQILKKHKFEDAEELAKKMLAE